MEEIVYHTNYRLENEYWWFVARNEIVKTLILQKTDIPQGSYIIDIGCGTGGFSEKISHLYNPVCLDTSNLAIEYCQKRGLKYAFQSTVEEFDFAQFPIKAAIMLDVIEHIEDDIGIMKQVYDKLPNGAWFITTVPAYQSLWSRHDEIHQHYRRYNRLDFNNLLRQVGFNIVYSSYFNTLLFAPAVLKRHIDKLTGAEKKQNEPVENVPPIVNKVFKNVFLLEKFLLGKIIFPFGLSIITIARKYK